MTKQDKELLLKDLSARIPYGVKVETKEGIQVFDIKWLAINMANIKNPYLPYLRPMSSITEEEKEEIKPLFSKFTDEFGKRVLVVRQNKMTLYQDWLNDHHFDYRGLIEKGLALEAPEGMYDFK